MSKITALILQSSILIRFSSCRQKRIHEWYSSVQLMILIHIILSKKTLKQSHKGSAQTSHETCPRNPPCGPSVGHWFLRRGSLHDFQIREIFCPWWQGLSFQPGEYLPRIWWNSFGVKLFVSVNIYIYRYIIYIRIYIVIYIYSYIHHRVV